MQESITYVGIDTAKKSHSIALVKSGEAGITCWEVSNTKASLNRLVKKLKKQADGRIECCYEAGPCGFELKRFLDAKGIPCIVVAPSLIPVKPGDRIKTDRRDAKNLAHYLRSGDLTEIAVPDEAQEAARDLVRLRASSVADQRRHRQQLGAFLLRRHFIFPGCGRNWTKRHREWLRGLKFSEPLAQQVFEEQLAILEQVEDRVRRLSKQVEELSEQDPYREPVGWLKCLKGFETVTAMTVVTEIFDFERFPDAPSLMAYLGLVPSEHSTGGPEKKRRGAITRTGNGHVRQALVEAAWCYRRTKVVGATLRRRRMDQPAWAVAVGDKALDRLHSRYWHLVNKGKEPNKAVVAVARELAGFIWALLHSSTGRSAPVAHG